MPLKQSVSELKFEETLHSPIKDIFEINKSTLNSIAISESVLSAIECLKTNENVNALLVKSQENPVGVISGRELTTNLCSTAFEKSIKMSVEDTMSTNFSIVDEETPVIKLIQSIQKHRRGISFVGEKTNNGANIIGSVTFQDLLELYARTTSSALISDLPLHETITISPNASILTGLNMMLKNNIRRIFLETENMPFVTERDIFAIVYDGVLKKDFSVLTKPLSHCKNHSPMIIKNETVKQICQTIITTNVSCVTTDKKYLVTPWDLTNAFLIDSIHEFREKLVESEKLILIGNLSARLAHDMRNPLSIIQVTLENIKMKYNIDAKEFEKIQRAIFRMTHQIDEVLDFVKKQPLTLDKANISNVIMDALDSVFIPNGMTMKLPKNDVELNCDSKKLSTAFTNLILNGIQAVNDNGVIEIRLEEKDDKIIIEFEDSGKGIPQESTDKIFEPLFTTKQQGTGLGLSSVKSIIDAHNGTIFVTSPPTIFTITLPKS